MSIRNKLVFALVAMMAVFIVVSNVISGTAAERSGKSLIADEVSHRLESVRELKRMEIEEYFSSVKNQLVTLSKNNAINELMVSSKSHFFSFKDQIDNKNLTAMRNGLRDFYDNQFGKKYARTNPGASNNQNMLMSALDDNSIALQYYYISNNPNPLGNKEALDHPGDNSAYSQTHEQYHPIVRSYLETFGYYDIFLVDPETGYIVYSVFKELDYATSLKNGPYANSGIAKAFQLANNSSSTQDYFLSDFASYIPSYNNSASFIATPISENGKKTGILIFQIPINKINHIMTSGKAWEKVGLGKTGESYLVGSDQKMLNMSRHLVENEAEFFNQLAAQNTNAETLSIIKAKKSTIGNLSVQSASTQLAMQKETGVHTIRNYLGTEVLSAYTPIEIAGVNLAIISEISVTEAQAPASKLKTDIINSVIGVLVVMLALTYLAVWWYTGKLTVPIDTFSKEIEEIQHNADLSHSIQTNKGDVTRDIAHSVNRMLEKFSATVTGISNVSNTLNESSSHVLNVTQESNKIVHKQKEQTATVTEAMQKMSSITHGVASNATDALEAAKVADQEAHSGRAIVKQTAIRLTQLADDMEKSSSVINKLKQDSESVGTVVEVINSIAEQTNLLALNAAIEAARAGEQGRGFAVVADEVRELARKTQNSTKQIQEIIEGLQHGAKDAVNAMEQGKQQAHDSVESAEKANASLQQITDSIEKIVATNGEIANATDSQSAVSEDINKALETMSDLSDQTANSTADTTQSVKELSDLANELTSVVKQFKLADETDNTQNKDGIESA